MSGNPPSLGLITVLLWVTIPIMLGLVLGYKLRTHERFLPRYVAHRLTKKLGVRASVGAATCRTVVSGRLDKLVMVISEVRVYNPDNAGFSLQPLATINQIEVLFDPWTLPSLCMEVDTCHIEDVDMYLERREGKTNLAVLKRVMADRHKELALLGGSDDSDEEHDGEDRFGSEAGAEGRGGRKKNFTRAVTVAKAAAGKAVRIARTALLRRGRGLTDALRRRRTKGVGVLGAEGGGAEGENGASDEDGLDGGWEGEEGRAAGGGSEDEDYFSDALDQAGAKRVEVLEIMVSTLTVRVWNGNLAEEGSVEPVLPRKKLYSPIGEENDVQSSEDEDGAQSAPRLYRFFSGEAPPVQGGGGASSEAGTGSSEAGGESEILTLEQLRALREEAGEDVEMLEQLETLWREEGGIQEGRENEEGEGEEAGKGAGARAAGEEEGEGDESASPTKNETVNEHIGGAARERDGAHSQGGCLRELA
ncbi:hypothetical protein T484DRAFT_1826574 [Baffinella frigidus]|nr:hypothetical protein T484DRAFT_1826574 [Cryptophyta sp. CCMP2293]